MRKSGITPSFSLSRSPFAPQRLRRRRERTTHLPTPQFFDTEGNRTRKSSSRTTPSFCLLIVPPYWHWGGGLECFECFCFADEAQKLWRNNNKWNNFQFYCQSIPSAIWQEAATRKINPSLNLLLSPGSLFLMTDRRDEFRITEAIARLTNCRRSPRNGASPSDSLQPVCLMPPIFVCPYCSTRFFGQHSD